MNFKFVAGMGVFVFIGLNYCLAQTVTLSNDSIDIVVVEARTGPDQQNIKNTTPVNTCTLRKGISWTIPCNQGDFVIFRSHVPENQPGEWIAAQCDSALPAVIIHDEGKPRPRKVSEWSSPASLDRVPCPGDGAAVHDPAPDRSGGSLMFALARRNAAGLGRASQLFKRRGFPQIEAD